MKLHESDRLDAGPESRQGYRCGPSCYLKKGRFEPGPISGVPEPRETGDRLASGRLMIDRDVPRFSTGELLRCGTGWLGNLERIAHTYTYATTLPAQCEAVKSRGARFGVSLWLDGGRKFDGLRGHFTPRWWEIDRADPAVRSNPEIVQDFRHPGTRRSQQSTSASALGGSRRSETERIETTVVCA